MMMVGMTLPLLTFPINTGFTYLSIQIILTFIMCLLKSLYSQERPYWDIYLEYKNQTSVPDPTECDAEFGNPSGHSLLSTYLLCLWDLFLCTNCFNKLEGIKKIIIKYVTLFLSIISIIFICYSRVNRQIHSFNQIIFGGILGVGFYFTFFHVLNLNRINTDDFIRYLDKAKFIFIPLCLLLFGISLTLGLTLHNDKEEQYKEILEKFCKYVPNQMFGKNTAFYSSIIFIIIGGYIGILFLKYNIQKNYPNKSYFFYNWNQGSKLTTFKITFFSFILPTILPALANNLLPFDYYALKLVVNSFIYFIFGFLSYGLLFYYSCIHFKKKELCQENNPLIVNDDKNIEA
jgi:H+/gluconate symporter-like permease